MTALQDAGIAFGALAAIITCLLLIARLRPVRWVWRTLVSNPLASWFRAQVRHEIEPVVAEVRERVVGVEKELATNGGGTMRDKLDAVLEEQARLREEIKRS